MRAEAGAFQPQLEEIGVVAGRLSLPKRERVEQREHERNQRGNRSAKERPAECAEEQEQRQHRRERPAGNEPEEIPLQSPRLAGGVVRAIRLGEAQLVFRDAGVHLLECADIHSRAVEAEGGEERLHDHRRPGDDEATDDGQLPGVGVAAANGEPSTDDTNGAEDEADEHDDSHRFARAFGETAGGLSKDGRELICE